MKKIRVSFFPAKDVGLASSRIRVFQLMKALKTMEVEGVIGFSLRSNVFFVQKKVTPKIIFMVFVLRLLGKRIIYDVDDLGETLWYWAKPKRLKLMLKMAHCVVTCSSGQQAILKRDYQVGKSEVVTNSIDYFPEGPERPAPRTEKQLRVIWFGNSSNFRMLEKYIATLVESGVQVVSVVGISEVEELRKSYPSVEFHAWDLATFLPILRSCDLACLMHDGDIEDTAKGNNRMITAINYGVPAIVSSTPEYTRTAQDLNVPDALFSSHEELLALIRKFSSAEARNAYLDQAQEKCWANYSPDTVARQFLRIFGEPLV
jgi:hypothetical protein